MELYEKKQYADGDILVAADMDRVETLIHNNGVINVKNFGAKGDGKTPDTKAIQDAVDYACKYQSNDKSSHFGTKIYFPTGHYIIDKPIFFQGFNYLNNTDILALSVEGDGFNTIISNAVPISSVGNYAPTFEGDYLFKFNITETNHRDLNISKLNFEIYQPGLSAIYLREGGMSTYISDIWIKNYESSHINIYSGLAFNHNVDIDNGPFSCGICAESITAGTFERVKINQFKNGVGLLIKEGYSSRVLNCDITYCKYGIYIGAGNNIIIENNRIDENNYGIYQNASNNLNPTSKLFSAISHPTDQWIEYKTKEDFVKMPGWKKSDNYAAFKNQSTGLYEGYLYNFKKQKWEQYTDNIGKEPFIKCYPSLKQAKENISQPSNNQFITVLRNPNYQLQYYKYLSSENYRLPNANDIVLQGEDQKATLLEPGQKAYWEYSTNVYIIRLNDDKENKKAFANCTFVGYIVDLEDQELPNPNMSLQDLRKSLGFAITENIQKSETALYVYGKNWSTDPLTNIKIIDNENAYYRYTWNKWVKMDEWFPCGFAGGLNAVRIAGNRFEATTFQAIDLTGYGNDYLMNNNINIDSNYWSTLGLNYYGEQNGKFINLTTIPSNNKEYSIEINSNGKIISYTNNFNELLKKAKTFIAYTIDENKKITYNQNLVFYIKNEQIYPVFLKTNKVFDNIQTFLENNIGENISKDNITSNYIISKIITAKYVPTETFYAASGKFYTIPYCIPVEESEQIVWKSGPMYIKRNIDWVEINEDYLLENEKTYSQAIQASRIYGLNITNNNFKGQPYEGTNQNNPYTNTNSNQNLTYYATMGNLVLENNTATLWKAKLINDDSVGFEEAQDGKAVISNTRIDNSLCTDLMLQSNITLNQRVLFDSDSLSSLSRLSNDYLINNMQSAFNYASTEVHARPNNEGRLTVLGNRNIFYLRKRNPYDEDVKINWFQSIGTTVNHTKEITLIAGDNLTLMDRRSYYRHPQNQAELLTLFAKSSQAITGNANSYTPNTYPNFFYADAGKYNYEDITFEYIVFNEETLEEINQNILNSQQRLLGDIEITKRDEKGKAIEYIPVGVEDGTNTGELWKYNFWKETNSVGVPHYKDPKILPKLPEQIIQSKDDKGKIITSKTNTSLLFLNSNYPNICLQNCENFEIKKGDVITFIVSIAVQNSQGWHSDGLIRKAEETIKQFQDRQKASDYKPYNGQIVFLEKSRSLNHE